MLRQNRALPLALALVAIAGCRETARCPSDMPRYENGECVRASDAGADAAELPDTGIDAGPCGGLCGLGEFCVAEACVECRVSEGDADCAAADPTRPFCAEGTCIECRADSECTSVGAPECDEPSGTCVACNAMNETTLCENTCDVGRGECSPVVPHSLTTCQSCDSDLQCASDHACVSMTYMGIERGTFCLRRSVGGSCSAPYGFVITGRASISSETLGDYCGIVESRTTCEAVLAFSRSCSASTPCPEGGTCGTVGGVGSSCTYGCTVEVQCPTDYTCDAAGTQLCR